MSTTFTPGKAFRSYNPHQTRNPYPAGSREADEWARDRQTYQRRLREHAAATTGQPADRRADGGAVNPYTPSPTDPTLAPDPALGPNSYVPGQVQAVARYGDWQAQADAMGRYGYQVRDLGAEDAARQEFDNTIAGEKAAWEAREHQREVNWRNWQAQLQQQWEARENANAYDYEKKHGRDYAARHPYQRQVYAASPYQRQQYTSTVTYQGAPQYRALSGANVARDENGVEKYWEQPGGLTREAYYQQLRTRENRSPYARTV